MLPLQYNTKYRKEIILFTVSNIWIKIFLKLNSCFDCFCVWLQLFVCTFKSFPLRIIADLLAKLSLISLNVCAGWNPHRVVKVSVGNKRHRRLWRWRPRNSVDLEKSASWCFCILMRRLRCISRRGGGPSLSYFLFIKDLTLFHICVDPGVVLCGLSVGPVLSALWMERSLSRLSESQSRGSLCVQIKASADFVADH